MSINRKVFINVSEVASYIGQNKWSIIEPFENIWRKADPLYNECIDTLKNKVYVKKNEIITIENKKVKLEEHLKNGIITKKQHTIDIKNLDKEITSVKKDEQKISMKLENIVLTQTEKIQKNLGKEITMTIADKNTDTKDKRKIVHDSIDKLAEQGKIKEEQRVELLKQTESLINKTHGIIKEQSAIDLFEHKFNVKLDISQKYYKHLVRSTNIIDWYIGGKLDGIAEDEKYIVEVKNRTKGFFSSLRDYELTQIQFYLLLTGYKDAKLVEKYNKNIRVSDISIDNDYIKEVIQYINLFIDSIEIFINDNDLKMRYINLESQSEKQMFLGKLYLESIIKAKNMNEERKTIENEDQNYMSDLDSDEI